MLAHLWDFIIWFDFVLGYVILYTTDSTRRDREWIVQAVVGGVTSASVRSLLPATSYHFKIQARNAKGYGPFSPIVSFTTLTGNIMFLVCALVVKTRDSGMQNWDLLIYVLEWIGMMKWSRIYCYRIIPRCCDRVIICGFRFNLSCFLNWPLLVGMPPISLFRKMLHEVIYDFILFSMWLFICVYLNSLETIILLFFVKSNWFLVI